MLSQEGAGNSGMAVDKCSLRYHCRCGCSFDRSSFTLLTVSSCSKLHQIRFLSTMVSEK
jgi:hypothetical protein